MQRRVALAAGAAIPAATAIAAGASSSDAECRAASPMSSSFEFISEAEIDDVSREIDITKGFPRVPEHGSASSSLYELQELGNGWVAPADEGTTRSVLALGRDLAKDPRVQAAILERVRGLPGLSDGNAHNSSQKLLEELKLVLVSREVAADGPASTAETTPRLSRAPSAECEPAAAEAGAEAEALKDGSASGAARPKGASAPKAERAAPAQAEEEDEPSLTAALLEAALVVASVIVLTVVARRFNPRACALAAAALAGAWAALSAPFSSKPRARGANK